MPAAITATNVLGSVEPNRATTPTSTVSPAAFANALRRAEASNVRLVTAVRTKLDAGQASAALAAAYRNVVGEEPSAETVKILTAQWAHETGHGASMFNYNFGGIKGASPDGLSVAQRTREGWGATEQTIVDNFRAYRTAEDGATDYVSLLKRRFPEALEQASAGDPQGFVRGLKARGYFTGNEASYTRSIVALSGVELPEGSAVTPPRLDAPFLERRGAAMAEVSLDGATFDAAQFAPPHVDALALAEEISRAALRIARATDSERRSG